MLLCLSQAKAASLIEYRERVGSAIVKLQTYDDHGEHPTPSEVHEARELLPPSETVEWNGTKFEVDNSWLREQLDRRL